MAYDPRFAMVLVGSSGEGGAKLHRRNFGEAVENLTGSGEYHERGVKAGESAVGLAAGRPEGHFWLAANMGRLAEVSNRTHARPKYRGRIRDELERVLAIDRGWQGGAADAALGQWDFEVPRLFGGSVAKAETHLRKALDYDPDNLVALVTLADSLESAGKREDARLLLQRVLAAPISPDWAPEDRDSKRDASERLARLSGK